MRVFGFVIWILKFLKKSPELLMKIERNVSILIESANQLDIKSKKNVNVLNIEERQRAIICVNDNCVL